MSSPTYTTAINVDLLDIPTPETLIDTTRTHNPQQVAELINKEFLTALKKKSLNVMDI